MHRLQSMFLFNIFYLSFIRLTPESQNKILVDCCLFILYEDSTHRNFVFTTTIYEHTKILGILYNASIFLIKKTINKEKA